MKKNKQVIEITQNADKAASKAKDSIKDNIRRKITKYGLPARISSNPCLVVG